MPRLSLRTRAVLALIALPGLVAFALPLLLVWRWHTDRPFSPIGLIPLAAGLVLLLWSARSFAVTGQGTLAPWDSPRRLVTAGPYRRSRNPMYLAIGLILAAWAVGFRSWPLTIYGLAALAAFHLRIVRAEEPQLSRAYGRAWSRYCSGVPRWIFPSRMALVLSLVALLAAIPIAGVFYEVYADAKAGRDFAPPGMFVDVGGRQLHVICIGEGTPAVLFEASGFGAGSLASAEVRNRVSRHTQVCSYDRAGAGWSDPAPDSMSSGDLARDLAVLQDRAGLPSPVILVASSIGGLTAEMFARQYPERVAGLVFLDPAHSGSLRAVASRLGSARAAATAGSVAAHLGLVRLLDPFRIPVDSEEGRRAAAMTYGSRAVDGLGAVIDGLPRSLEEFDQAPPLPGDVPLVVLSASNPDALDVPWLSEAIGARAPERVPSQRTFATASSRGSWRLVPDSDHLVATSQPEAVIDAVVALLEETRASTAAVRPRRR